jgi:hypothetical protein
MSKPILSDAACDSKVSVLERVDERPPHQRRDVPDPESWPARALPFMLIFGLGLLLFFRLVLHPSWVLHTDFSDLLTYQVPQEWFLVSSWHKTGEIPLWCPYSFGGIPFIHDIQVGAFYPPHILLYLVSAEMVGPTLSWLIVAHVIVAGWTMFAYSRVRGLNRICALVAAAGFMFSGKWLLHLLAAGQYVTVGLAWLPLVLLLLERSLGGGGLRSATWAGLALAMVVLGSHPQLTFYAGVLIALWTLPVALEQAGVFAAAGWMWQDFLRALVGWSAAIAWASFVALTLTAIQLLPTLEAATLTTRGAMGMRSNVFAEFLFSFSGLIGPAPAGLPTTMGWEYRTGWTALGLATAVLAPALIRGRVRFQLQAGGCLLLILFGMGAGVLLQTLPGFRLFRIPSRMFLIVSLPVALLMGIATQALSERLSSHRGLGGLVRGLLILVLLLGLASAYSLTMAGGSLRSTPLLIYWGSSLLLLPVAVWLTFQPGRAERRKSRWTSGSFQLAWGAILLADSWAMGLPLVSVRPQAPIYEPPACVRLVVERRKNHERALDREVPGHWEHTPFEFALPMLERLDQIRGYNPLDILRYKEFIQFISDRVEPLPPANGIGNFPLVNLGLLDFLGTRFLVQPTTFPRMSGEVQSVTDDARWQAIGEDPSPESHLFVPSSEQRLPPYTVYRNGRAFPRAFLVPRAEPLPERSRVLAALKQADLRSVVFLEDFDPGSQRIDSLGRFEAATITAYQPNHVVIETDSDAPGYVVLTDPWYPGWTCTVDGQAATLHRANYAFRAVAVRAGTHRVRFDFAPVSYQRGRLISTVALAGILGLGVVSVLRQLGRSRGTRGQSIGLESLASGSEM